jgi:ATP-dependent DNA helicase RecG
MTNTSLRERFGLDEKGISSASRIIRDTINANMIKSVDPTTAPTYLKYVPFWV